MRRLIGVLLLLGVFAGAAGGYWLVRFATTPIDLPANARDLQVKKGRSLKGLSSDLTAAGVLAEPWSCLWMGRVPGRGNDIQAGYYALPSRMTPYRLLEMIANGEVTETQITFIEGWSFAQVRAALNAHPLVVHDTTGMSDLDVL